MISITPISCSSSQTYLRHRTRLLALAKAHGCDVHEAEDVVQDMFAKLLRMGRLEDVNALPETVQSAVLGRRLKSVLMNRWRDQQRQCRDARRTIALDELETMDRTLACQRTPAMEHDYSWAMRRVTDALKTLRDECGQRLWQELEPALHGDGRHAATARCRVAVHRVRKRLRTLICTEEMRSALLTFF
ncbi:MAG: hypothetical protein NTV80_06925 [Verrucomicrobia bacterium]|nr:hypothetical protein [Verrucomicrobiota bacterium]